MIRTATIEDSASISALSIQVWLETYVYSGIRDSIARYVLSTCTEQKTAEIIRAENYHYLLYIRDEHLLGYALLNTTAPCAGLIE
ncbi:hypothetical protein M3P05_13830 [Sansalvadorimonas sp. 2012CJ34-2]|uniref:Uncharacterized protein n=1 Tax=Parendozoicomonas callyspongiae TaxID=2942213 RepID=A0ABT0PID3_9GAMM|nr:hypothetical protein [Sansalvadorimonas sp. 2012CJ34-2]MCL6271006.1 hypothetical protein [Sansalvadorimonas sp. 2012CJ34-2]